MSNERVGEVSLDIKLQANTGEFQKEIEQMVENTNRTLEGLDASDIKNKLEELKNSLNSFSQNVEKSMQEIQGSFNSLGLSKDVIDSYTKMASVFNELANNKFFDSLGEASVLLKQNFSVLSEQMESFSKEKINTSNETTGLADVKKAVDDITAAILEKNQSFVDEERVVADASKNEVSSLQNVLNKVREIGEEVNKIDFKNWGQVPTPSAPAPEHPASSPMPDSGSSSQSSAPKRSSRKQRTNSQNEEKQKLKERRDAYKHLINTELRYQELVALESRGSATEEEIQELKELISLREKEIALIKDRSNVAAGTDKLDTRWKTEQARATKQVDKMLKNLDDVGRVEEPDLFKSYKVLIDTEEEYQKLLYKRKGTDDEGGSGSNFTTKELEKWLDITQQRATAEQDINAAKERGVNLAKEEAEYEKKCLEVNKLIESLSHSTQNDKIVQAYKALTATEEQYQSLIRKRNGEDSNLTEAELKQLMKLETIRNKANEIVSQATNLTKGQTEAQKEYAEKVDSTTASINRLNQAESARISKKYGESIGSVASESEASSFISQQIQNKGWTQLSDIISKRTKNGGRDYSVQVKNANKELQKMVYHLEAAADGSYTVYENITTTTHASTLWEKIVGSLEGKFKALATYLASFATVQQLWTWIKTGAGYVKELNTQLTEMRKVSDESIRTLKSYQKETFAIADAVGTTAAQIQSSTADYLRLGESMSSAAELAKNTNILMNVSEFDSIEKATESMIAMKQAYGELGSMDIIDKLNLAGNNFPISTSELAESLQRSAAALKVAGNDINEAIALTVAGNSILQDPDSVASGLRTISMRLTGTTASELTAIGEDTEGLIETTSKLRDTIRSLTAVNGKMGVSITDSVGKYKSTFEILSEIADRWEDIAKQDAIDGKNRQNAIMESVAGKNRAAIFAAIMQSPELLKQAYEEVQDASGSAQKELDTYLESTEAHLKKLTNSVQEMWDTTLNSDFLNFFIDLGTIITNLTTKAGGLIPVASAFVGLIGSLAKNVGGENRYPSWNMPTHISSLFKEKSLSMWLAFVS